MTLTTEDESTIIWVTRENLLTGEKERRELPLPTTNFKLLLRGTLQFICRMNSSHLGSFIYYLTDSQLRELTSHDRSN